MLALVEPSGRIAQMVPDGGDFPVAEPLAWVVVPDGTSTADSWDGATVVKHQPLRPTAAAVAEEAERRIADGILVDEQPFRADDTSRQRLRDMIGQFRRGNTKPTGQTFRTKAGQEFTWTRIEQPQAVADEIGGYVVALLSRSAELQRSPPADVTVDHLWPPRPTITVSARSL